MIDRCDSCFTLIATTKRTRANGLSSIALCHRCASAWDQAIAATHAKMETPTHDEVRTLVKAVRYLVYNTLPNTMAGDRDKTRLIEQLDTVIKPGK